MEHADLDRAVAHARKRIVAAWPHAKDHNNCADRACHMLWMLGQIDEFMSALPPRTEKAMRWLGFVQGFLWSLHVVTIDELKSVNRPSADVT